MPKRFMKVPGKGMVPVEYGDRRRRRRYPAHEDLSPDYEYLERKGVPYDPARRAAKSRMMRLAWELLKKGRADSMSEAMRIAARETGWARW